MIEISNLIKAISLLIFTILTAFIVGPIFSVFYRSSIQPNTVFTGLTSCSIAVTVGLVDTALYSIGLYLSIQAANELYLQRTSDDKKMIIQEPISRTIESLTLTQTTLHDLIKNFLKENNTDPRLIQITLDKLATLEFSYKDDIEKINKSLQLNQSVNKNNQQSLHINFIPSKLSNSHLFDRVYFFIFTFSFLLYIHQIVLWFFQYLSLQNLKKYSSYSFILSVIILGQSLGFIYFLQITNTFYFLSPLYMYTCILFLRSLSTIYHYAFSIY
jgi:hypothetical protein